MSDPHDLQRFVDAQDQSGTYERALAELRAGRKTSHWMWFVFPQIAGLGRSPTARQYAISDLEEAEAYLAHPVLGERLVEASWTLVELDGKRPAEEVLGPTDAMKLRSSMTLFASLVPNQNPPVFQAVLNRYFAGKTDPATERLLAGSTTA